MSRVAAQDEWTRYLLEGRAKTPYGLIDNKSPYNANILLKYHPETKGRFVYDEFSDRCLIVDVLPWVKGDEFRVKKIDDNDAHQAMLWLELQGVKISKGVAFDCLNSIARENRTNPAKEYFESLAWDQVPRLALWLETYLGASNQPPEYLTAVGKKWLVAVAMRAYQPGAKFDHMIILEGAQGLGKSSALRELATFGDQSFFYDGGIKFNDTDTLMKIQGKIIIEMAEMASFKKAVNEEIKAFISREVDVYRTPYARTTLERPRYFVLSGSTNEKEYLPPDESGHRRYWPVECHNINIEKLKADREQLWAEAVYLYKNGFETWVRPDEVEMFRQQQESRVIQDAWSDLITNQVAARGDYELTIDDVFGWLEISNSQRDNFTRKRVKDVLQRLGMKETRDSEGRRIWRHT